MDRPEQEGEDLSCVLQRSLQLLGGEPGRRKKKGEAVSTFIETQTEPSLKQDGKKLTEQNTILMKTVM